MMREKCRLCDAPTNLHNCQLPDKHDDHCPHSEAYKLLALEETRKKQVAQFSQDQNLRVAEVWDSTTNSFVKIYTANSYPMAGERVK